MKHCLKALKQQSSQQFQASVSQPNYKLENQQSIQQQIPMQPQKPKLHGRLSLTICVAILVLIVISVTVLHMNIRNHMMATGEATQPARSIQQLTSQPTAPFLTTKPSPVVSTTTANVGESVLGGTLSSFIAKFGQPNNHSSSGIPHFQRCSNSDVDQLILSQKSLESTLGPITSIDVQACTSTLWHIAQATNICSSYFPPDVKYQLSISIADTQGQHASVDRVYYSAKLASIFASDNFTDANGKLVQPGLFDIEYRPNSNNDTSYVDSCTIQLGVRQTNG